ncbi:hypothetical protein ES703_10162 [subsurface metagenome]
MKDKWRQVYQWDALPVEEWMRRVRKIEKETTKHSKDESS